MTLNTRNISSAENHDSHFYRPTWTHTNTNTHIHRKVSWKQLLGFKSSLSPPTSLTRAGTSEQGSACRVGPERSGWALKEACGREGFSGRGSALLEVLDIIGKAFSLPCSAAEQLSFIFLYLSHHNGKTVSKTHVTGIFPGKEGLNNCNQIPEEEDAWNKVTTQCLSS